MSNNSNKSSNTSIIEAQLGKFLHNQDCINAGIVPLSIKSDIVSIGAMNPIYKKVQDVVKQIESKYQVNVELRQITPEEWDRWQEGKLQTIESSSSLKNYSSDNPDRKKSLKLTPPVVTKSEDQSSIKEISKGQETSLLKEILQNNSLASLNNSQLESESDKFDFFELDEEEELEEEIDIIDDKDLSDTNDPVIKAAGSILATCVRLKASDIHAEPLEERMRIRYRIDGVLKEIYSLPKIKARAITSRLKVMSKLDIAERRLPQDGRIRCRINETISDFRVSTLPGKWGEKIVLRALQSDSSMLNLEKLISSEEELSLVRTMGSSPYGIFIVVGPTGSGKSTTLYSILNERNTPDVNISTVEDPVEYTLDGIHQVQVIREKGLDFSRALRSLMRQDPDIILVGETRDRETAQTAMEAALTGHMVFTTLHANDTATAITRLGEMGIPPYLVGSSVIGVMAQRLIRKICPSCSSERPVDSDKDQVAIEYGIQTLKKAKIIDLTQSDIDQNDLCSTCNGTGYKGRLGLYEVMKVTDPIRELIMKSSTADVIRECAEKNGVKSLLDYGMELVKQKVTTLEEVSRVCLLND
tara:strand:+ start:763 stop:2520 length:1758 start_codon:yes stop_codon:yes gene_type:complete